MEMRTEPGKEMLEALKRQEEQTNRRLLRLETVIGCLSSVSFLVMLLAASLAVTEFWWRAALIGVGLAVFIVGTVCALRLEHDAGYYECPECGKRYVPDMKAMIFAPHIGRSRRLTCPKCGERAYQRKVLTK